MNRVSIIFFIGVLAVSPVSAQSVTSFSLSGIVQDQTGAILPSISVDLLSESGAVLQTTVTDMQGAFSFKGAVGGTYDLRVELDGFKTATVRVRIGSRPPALQKIVLALADFRQEITVSDDQAAPTTGATDNRDTIVLDADALQNLPVFDQDIIGAASRFLDAGSLGTGGATLVVDGMETSSLGVSASAIQQIKINQDPYTAESARPGRGRIEVITKAGAQNFHGAGGLVVRDARLNSRNVFASTKAPEQRRIYEGTFSGPALNGKTTSFLMSSERREQDAQAVVFALTPAGPFVANVPQPARSMQASASMNHQHGKNNTVFLRYTHEADSTRNQGIGGTTLPDAGSYTHSWENQVIYGQQTILTSKLVHQFRMTLGEEGGSTVSSRPAPRIVVLDAFTAGGAQNDRGTSQHRIGVLDTITYASGVHVFKAGLNIPEWNWRRNDDLSNVLGTFTFSTLDDYVAGHPLSFVQQQGDGRLRFIEKNLGLFVQDQLQIRPTLSMAVGLRYDWQNYLGDRNNFAPRASFAYAPPRLRGTVVRGGTGIFYDRLEGGAVAGFLRSAAGRSLRYLMLNSGYPDPFSAGSASAPPPSIVVMAPNAVSPHTWQYSLGVERQVHKSLTVAVNYIATRGFDLFRSRDINAPPPPTYATRPNPAYGVVRQIESTAQQRTQSLQFTLRGRFGRVFDGSAQYVFATAKNNTGGINALPANNYDLASEWGRADFNQRSRFDLVGGVTLGTHTKAGISIAAYSGQPYSLRTGRDEFNTGQTNARPTGVARNTLTGPDYWDVDLRLSRDIAAGRQIKGNGPATSIGIDAFNVLNRVNYSSYIGTATSSFFGRAISAQPPRRIQLSLRYKF